MDRRIGQTFTQGPTLGDILDLGDNVEDSSPVSTYARNAHGDPDLVSGAVDIALLDLVTV